MLELAKLIDIILSFASPAIQNQLQRNELVIKLLKQLNLDPDHPPADFSAVYQYTLVEYGIGKPKPVLELFRQAEIQEIFRQALDQNNPSWLLQAGEAFLAKHVLGDRIRALGVDARREFYQFAAVFIAVAKRTRTPAEVLTNQKIESLHRQIGSVQARLNRLPTLEGIRTEMARLAAQTLPALPGAIVPAISIQESQFQESQCRAFALAQQMKGWFETLGYRFESYEVWQDDYFEWVIDIPVRRGRYDRILVRGIDGEAGVRDIKTLRQSVERQRADEGWLVTARRISRAARQEVEKAENRDLGCYTLDELLDQDADFRGYLDWLETEVQRRGIEQKYVPLACTKEEIDPDTKQRIGVSHYDDRDGWIDGYIDLWLDDPAKEHISVLGEFGTGKTWFAFHYASQALKRYREAQQRGVERPRLPLVIPLRDYAKAVSVESLFSEFFFRKHEVRSLTYSAFEQLNRMGKLLLIFDGFDEMAARVDRQEMINNFWELAKVVVPGAKVILTCRTEHFPEAKEGRALLNAELQASTSNLTGETPQFEVLELEKFNDEQIQQVLSLQAEVGTVEQVMRNPQLLDLARRPVMTELILEALPDIEAGKPVDMSRVYLYAVRRKMERDIKEERTFTSLAEKLYFLCELSWEMLSSDRMSLNYREFPDRIRRLFGSVVQEEKDLDHWHYDMMGQTMLIRNADGDYMPAHRSLLEFFVAYKFAAELGLLADDFAEVANQAYFEDPVNLNLTFGEKPISKAVCDLILPMLNLRENLEERLFKIILETRNHTSKIASFAGGNAVNLLLRINPLSLCEKDLSSTTILGVDFTDAYLNGVCLENADLTYSIFTKSFGSVMEITCSPNNQLIASSDRTGGIRLWSFISKQEVARLHKEFNGNNNHQLSWTKLLIFTRDSQKLISACGKFIDIWDVSSYEHIKTLNGHSSDVSSLALNPKNTLIISGSKFPENAIKIWDMQTGECLRTLVGHSDSIRSISTTTDGRLIISGSASEDASIKVWDIESGECIKTCIGHSKSVRHIITLSKQNRFISGDHGSNIKIWNIESGENIETLTTDFTSLLAMDISPDEKILATGGSDHLIRLWDLSKQSCERVLQGHKDWVESIVITNDGKNLLSGSSDATIRIWDIDTDKCIHTFQGCTNWVLSVSINQYRSWIASGSDDHTIKLWNLETHKCERLLTGHTGWVDCIEFCADGTKLASCSADKTVKVWNAENGQCIYTLEGHQGRVWSVAFSLNQKYLVSSSRDSTIRLWNLESDGECIGTFFGHEGSTNRAVLTHDNQHLISCGEDSLIRIWDVTTKKCITELRQHRGSVNSLSLAIDDSLLATAGADHKINLWDLSKRELFAVLEGHTDEVESVVLYPDSKTLASCGRDKTIRIWDIVSLSCTAIFTAHNSWVSSIAIGEDCKTLVSGSWDETIRVWDTSTGSCILVLNNKPYINTNIRGAKGLSEADKKSLKALGAIEDE